MRALALQSEPDGFVSVPCAARRDTALGMPGRRAARPP